MSSVATLMFIPVLMLLGFVLSPLEDPVSRSARAQHRESTETRSLWDRIEFVKGSEEAESAARRKADAELARLRNERTPVTAAELEQRYMLPAGAVDTTRLWISGSSSLVTDAFKADAGGIHIVDRSIASDVPAVGHVWPELNRSQRLLQQYRLELDQLHEAARNGGAARFPTQFHDGLRMRMPHLLPLLAATRALALEAHVRAHGGDIGGAVTSLETLFAAARSLESYPHSVAHLVCVAMYAQGFGTLHQLLVEMSDLELQRIERALDKCNLDDSLHEVMIGERVIGLLELEDPQRFIEYLASDEAEDARQITREQADQYARLTPFVKQRDIWLFLRHMRGVVDASREPLPDRLQMVQSAGRQLETWVPVNPAAGSETDTIYKAAAGEFAILAHLIAPGHDATFLANARTIAQQRLMATAVGVERFRRETGHLPDMLRQLIPRYLQTIPVDPFDGKEVRYVRRSNGFRIYSVGWNCSDEGGAGAFSGNDADVVIDVPMRQGRE